MKDRLNQMANYLLPTSLFYTKQFGMPVNQPEVKCTISDMVSYGPEKTQVYQFQKSLYIWLSISKCLLGVACGERFLYSQACPGKHPRFFERKGFSLVYLQAFQECIHIIVVSATTHFTTCLRKLRKRDFCLPFQECLVKVEPQHWLGIYDPQKFFGRGGGGAMEVTCSAVLKTSFIADVGYITYQILG